MNLNNKNKTIIVDILKKHIPQLQAIYLFGSQKDGTATMESDIDIAYLSTQPLSSVERWDVFRSLLLRSLAM